MVKRASTDVINEVIVLESESESSSKRSKVVTLAREEESQFTDFGSLFNSPVNAECKKKDSTDTGGDLECSESVDGGDSECSESADGLVSTEPKKEIVTMEKSTLMHSGADCAGNIMNEKFIVYLDDTKN